MSFLTVDLAERTPVRALPQEPARGGPLAAALSRIWHRRYLFATVFAAILGLAVTALLMIQPQYVASGSVIVAEAEPGANNASMAWIQKIGDPADIESQILVIRSPRLLRLAIDDSLVAAVLAECRYAATGGHPDRISEKKDAACTKLTTDRNALIEYLQKRYTVLSSGRSRIITIGYKSPLPETAQTMANGLINAFLDDQRETQASSRKAAADWLHTEISQLDASIRADETRIQTFRRRKGLLKGSTAPISAERLTSISQLLAAAETAKADAAARLSEIENRGARGADSAPAVLASPTVVSLKQRSAASARSSPTRAPSWAPTIRSSGRSRPSRRACARGSSRRSGTSRRACASPTRPRTPWPSRCAPSSRRRRRRLPPPWTTSRRSRAWCATPRSSAPATPTW
ncbi:GumC family protein [Methylobacterium oryzae CBMB20]